jgi:hypothetical protein
VPGPGQYNTFFGKYGPKISMGVKSKTLTNEQQVPGPGNYNVALNSIYKNSNGFTMGAKYSNKNNDPEPGPGAYSYDTTILKKSGVKIGTSIRK